MKGDMLHLKKELIDIIGKSADNYVIGNSFADLFNMYCNTSYVWHCEGNNLMIELGVEDKEDIEEVLDFLDGLVGCSYFQETTGDMVTLKFTLSTLLEKLHNLCEKDNEDELGYVPVQMNRFKKIIPDENSRGYSKRDRYIVDNELLSENWGSYEDGVIVSAVSSSEWVNDYVIDKVLEILNTDPGIVNMLNYCNHKK